MRLLYRSLALSVLGILTLVAVSSANGTAIKITSASHYGPGSNFASCASPSNSEACEAFNLTSQGSVTLDGLINFNVYQFAFNQNENEGPLLDVFNLGSLAPGQTLTLFSTLFSATDLANAQIFSCANGLAQPSDSLDAPVNGPCTPGLGATGNYSPLISNGVVNGVASFSTAADFDLTDLVLEVPMQPSTPVATPEPASLVLVGTGLAALAGLKRRKH